jgi:hypothetical protein
MMKAARLSILLCVLVSHVAALSKLCRPTFHDKYLSGGDEFSMRWEYCTKMSFSRKGYGEWHTMATYEYPELYKAFFLNYLVDTKESDPDKINPNTHLLQLDLAVYDEI